MSVPPEQEAEWFQQLEKMGVATARESVAKGLVQSAFVNATYRWLAEKDREVEAKKEASISAQIAEARRASTAAERQATAAERANTRATIALMIAIASMIISTVAIVITHMDTTHEQTATH